MYAYIYINTYSLCSLSFIHTYSFHQRDELLSLIFTGTAEMSPFLEGFHAIQVTFNHFNFTLIQIIKYSYILHSNLFSTVTGNQLH